MTDSVKEQDKLTRAPERVEYRDHVFENPHAEMSTLHAYEYTYTCQLCGEKGDFYLAAPSGVVATMPQEIDLCLRTHNKTLHQIVQERKVCPTCKRPI